MFKIVTLYRKVENEAQLEEFFSATHLPLAEKLPGLRKSEVSRVTGKPGGQSRFHLMYELYFDSFDAFHQALGTEIGKQFMVALLPWNEARLIDWFYADSFSEELAIDD